MHYTIRFSKQDPSQFFKTLQQRVNDYFTKNAIPQTGTPVFYIKAVLALFFFFVPYTGIISGLLPGWWALAGYFLMGLGAAGIGFSVMHDANHGSYSKLGWVNKLMSYTMELIGGSSFTWKIQHNLLHHSYTNIYHMDEDIADKPFLRLSPHAQWKRYHRFQHCYAFFLYSLSTLSWVIMKDFKQLVQYNRSGLTLKNGFHPLRETIVMLFSKVAYVFYTLVLPILLGVSWGPALAGFILLHLVSGFTVSLIFQLAHLVEGPQQISAAETGSVENSWAIHQLHSTANFSTRNKFITWLVGGLNFQIEHHLFPTISHIHYPKIADIVKKTVEEFGLPYYEFPKLHYALSSHVKMLKTFGKKPF